MINIDFNDRGEIVLNANDNASVKTSDFAILAWKICTGKIEFSVKK